MALLLSQIDNEKRCFILNMMSLNVAYNMILKNIDTFQFKRYNKITKKEP